MTPHETYGADFVKALKSLTRLTVLSYADRQEIATLNQDQLAARMQGARYEFFKVIRDNPADQAAKILLPQRHLWAGVAPSPSISAGFAVPTLKQFSAKTLTTADAPVDSDAAYGARFMKRMQQLTGMTSFSYAERREYETLTQEEFAQRCRRHSFDLFQLIQQNAPETAAEIVVEYQRMVASRTAASVWPMLTILMMS